MKTFRKIWPIVVFTFIHALASTSLMAGEIKVVVEGIKNQNGFVSVGLYLPDHEFSVTDYYMGN